MLNRWISNSWPPSGLWRTSVADMFLDLRAAEHEASVQRRSLQGSANLCPPIAMSALEKSFTARIAAMSGEFRMGRCRRLPSRH